MFEVFATTKVVPFFALPSLLRLEGYWCMLGDMRIGADPDSSDIPVLRRGGVLLPHTSSVTDIQWDSSDLETFTLHKILLLPRALAYFSYTVASRGVFYPLFDSAQLSKALQSHRSRGANL